MLVSQNNPAGVELFCYVKTFFCSYKFVHLSTFDRRVTTVLRQYDRGVTAVWPQCDYSVTAVWPQCDRSVSLAKAPQTIITIHEKLVDVPSRIQLFVRYSFAGGYLSDSAAFVAKECQQCPVGAFAKLDIYPGTRYKHCRACPRGKCTRTHRLGV